MIDGSRANTGGLCGKERLGLPVEDFAFLESLHGAHLGVGILGLPESPDQTPFSYVPSETCTASFHLLDHENVNQPARRVSVSTCVMPATWPLYSSEKPEAVTRVHTGEWQACRGLFLRFSGQLLFLKNCLNY